MLKAGCTRKEICIATGKDKSVISRELKRYGGKRGYSASQAQEYADIRKERFRRKRKFTGEVEERIIHQLTQQQWSPEQIVGRARKEGVAMVSHERIYQFVRADRKEGGTLYKHLRHRLKHRKRPVSGKKVLIPDKVSIDSRGDIINNRERFGDWEIDTVIGKEGKGAILTATERKTGVLLMKKLKRGKNAKSLANELFLMMLPYKKFVHSITSDNGCEFYEHRLIAQRLDADYYFAHPYSSWERGLNEYTNGLIRQYILKKQSFIHYDDDFIKCIQHKINRRPRKNLNFDNPLNRFFHFVALAS
jgi:IS30 family transposase